MNDLKKPTGINSTTTTTTTNMLKLQLQLSMPLKLYFEVHPLLKTQKYHTRGRRLIASCHT